MIPVSILDLAPVCEGFTVADAIDGSRRMAIEADKLGFHRYWLAEHHGMRAVSSAATSVMLAQAGAVTQRIRIGSGGIMLPNHSPLQIAEQFGTLAAMFPGRVDLGLGRAPGTDPRTAAALRRPSMDAVERYSEDIDELRGFLGEPTEDNAVIAIPGQGTQLPLWLLGSSLYSAQLAAQKGLPFAFASHFAPDFLIQAIEIYRQQFRPSAQLERPYVMAGVMAAVAETDEQADYLFSSARRQFINLRQNLNKPFQPPVVDLHDQVSDAYWLMTQHTLRYALVGSRERVRHQFQQFVAQTGIDELIVSLPIYDIDERLSALACLQQSCLS